MNFTTFVARLAGLGNKRAWPNRLNSLKPGVVYRDSMPPEMKESISKH
jgi:hypothetical protein